MLPNCLLQKWVIDASTVNTGVSIVYVVTRRMILIFVLRMKSHFNLHACVFRAFIADSKNNICFSLKELKKYGVTTLVRVCDATYDKAPVEKEGIHVLVSV